MNTEQVKICFSDKFAIQMFFAFRSTLLILKFEFFPDFRSDVLWERYIEWELERKNLRNVTSIYRRLIAIPTKLYNRYLHLIHYSIVRRSAVV